MKTLVGTPDPEPEEPRAAVIWRDNGDGTFTAVGLAPQASVQFSTSMTNSAAATTTSGFTVYSRWYPAGTNL